MTEPMGPAEDPWTYDPADEDFDRDIAREFENADGFVIEEVG